MTSSIGFYASQAPRASSAAQQSQLSAHRVRQGFVEQRTEIINRIRVRPAMVVVLAPVVGDAAQVAQAGEPVLRQVDELNAVLFGSLALWGVFSLQGGKCAVQTSG